MTIYPDNGWSLFGLSQSLKAQGREKEAEEVQQHFATAWQYADFDSPVSSLLLES